MSDDEAVVDEISRGLGLDRQPRWVRPISHQWADNDRIRIETDVGVFFLKSHCVSAGCKLFIRPVDDDLWEVMDCRSASR